MNQLKSPDKRVKLITDVPLRLRQELKAKAALQGLNMREAMVELIKRYLQES